MKLRITIDGKTYDAEVEILETEESGSHFNRIRRIPPPYARTRFCFARTNQWNRPRCR